jgi:hypothetical protein
LKNILSFSKKSIPYVMTAALLLPNTFVQAQDTTSSASTQQESRQFQNTMDISKIAGYSTGFSDEEGGVAEIVKYNPHNKKFYVINGKAQTIDIVSLKGLSSSGNQTLVKEKSINIATAVNSTDFTYGDLTSIDINTTNKVIVAAVQEQDYSKAGKIVVMNYDGKILKTFDAGIQPDMIKMSADGSYILTANEGEPRKGLVNGVDPEGSVTIVNYKTGKTNLVKFTDTKVIDDNVHIRNNAGKENAVRDLEPEYIALSDDNKKAYVTLQENNAIATIDVHSGKVSSVKSLGFKDHSLPQNALDAARDDKINITSLPIKGVYMPDSITQVTIGGESYLVTANEGDATEWEEFTNVVSFKDIKDGITIKDGTFKGMTKEEAESKLAAMKSDKGFDKLEVLTDMGTDAVYTLGGRSFSIWKADTMELVYDSGSEFEKITAETYPQYFNWSNDDDVMDKRSAKKGPEPEDVKIGKVGNKVYAFIGLERIGGIMSYDITDPSKVKFANYTNTRDFSGKIAGDVAPEGLEFIPAEVSPTLRPLVLTGNEVSGTVSVNQLNVKAFDPSNLLSVNRVDNNDKSITGTAVANGSVYAVIGKKTYQAVANSAGKYSIKIPLTKAETTITVYINDAAGDKLVSKTTKVIDKTAPKLTVNAVNIKSKAIKGVTEKKATVTVKVGSKTYKAKVDGKGNYSLTIKTQKAGTNITVYSKDKAGNTSSKKLKVSK